MLKIRKASEFCDFNEFLDEVLCDKFNLGLHEGNSAIWAHLLCQIDMTFKNAVETASLIKQA